MIKKNTLKNVITYFCMFLVLLYPFNATIDNIIYPNSFICLLSVSIGVLGLILSKDKFGIEKKEIIFFLIILIAIIFTLFNNYYIVEGRSLRVILFVSYLFLPFAFYNNDKLKIPFTRIIKIFCIEHIIGTFIEIIFKEYYKNVILVKICTGKTVCTAIGNNYHGYMTGFTTHFSTNAIYLSIASLFFFSEFLQKKEKKSIIFFILSIIALFTAGKRAHLIFTILCCLLTFIAQKSKNAIKKYFKLFTALLFSTFIFVIISKYIPEMTNILSRFEILIENGDVMNGRTELYDLAFSLWDRHLFLGNGWGSFSYYYQLILYTPGSKSFLDAHNVFIQLLCETGLVGFLFFVSIMIISLIKSLVNIKKNNEIALNSFVFSYQLFFILYCFTGNPLYDPMCYVIYFIAIGLTFIKFEKKGNKI